MPIAVTAALSAGDAIAAPAARRIDIPARDLRSALSDVARRAGVDILYGPDLVQGLQAPAVRGAASPDAALQALLAGSGLGFRRGPEGAYVIYRLPPAPAQDTAITTVPEILIKARRAQNADIARNPDDIQPYRVWSAQDIASSNATTADGFLRSRVATDAQSALAQANPRYNFSSVRSEVSLRGLSSNETLVLIDGRRIPGLSNLGAELQGDINGVPLSAIDRVEVLSATAGGIFGPGATGGAVNIVLKRDFNGAGASADYGLTERGGASVRRFEGYFGRSFGRTSLMLEASQARQSGLSVGDRDYALRARNRLISADPTQVRTILVSNAYNVASVSGETLRLRSDLGGQALGSAYTYAPIGQTNAATFLSNAGRIGPEQNAFGQSASLLSQATSSSLIGNLRQDFGGGVEAYLDLMRFETVGRSRDSSSSAVRTLAAGSPYNPFDQAVTVTLPTAGYGLEARNSTTTSRGTAGVIVPLPKGWRATAEATQGHSRVDYKQVGSQLGTGAASAIADPFSPELLAALVPVAVTSQKTLYRGTVDSRQLSLRLAGKVFELPGGPATLSFLVEHRTEDVAPSAYVIWFDQLAFPVQYAAGKTQDDAVYSELRAPIGSNSAEHWWLRGLEAQLAVRQDRVRIARTPPSGSPSDATYNATAYTAGWKVTPTPSLLVRASVSTGALPPSLQQYQENTVGYLAGLPFADPLRPGQNAGQGPALVRVKTGGGSPRSERARTLTAGVVLTPAPLQGLRLSVDYVRIDKTREIVIDPALGAAYYVARESAFPARVTRAPLTAADQAQGYGAGQIIAIDARGANIGRTRIEAVDFAADYLFSHFSLGDLRLKSAVTWQPRFERRVASEENLVGYFDGPLAWRGNFGASLSRGNFTFDLSSAYFGTYRIASSTATTQAAALAERAQGAEWIRAQVYFDGALTWRPAWSDGGVSLKLAVQNLLDARPPLVVSSEAGSVPYSLYGDPRGRRYEATISRRF